MTACLASAANWLTQHAIYDKDRFRDDKGLHLIDKPGAVVWSRFYDIASGQPVFFDRDGKTYQDVHQISLERQQGYGWYQYEAAKFLRQYQAYKTHKEYFIRDFTFYVKILCKLAENTVLSANLF